MGNTPAWNPDPATLKSAQSMPAQATSAWNPDASTLTPVNVTPEYTRGRTLANMTAAMSGQQMPNSEDQPRFEEGKKAGMASAAATTAVSAGAGALAAPSVITKAGPLVPAGRDAAGKFLPWIASQISEEGPSLAQQGVSAAVQFAKDHPVASMAIGSALGKMGAGTAMHFLKKLGVLAAAAE